MRKSWSTSSFGGSVDTSAMDLSALGDHLGLCKSPSGPLFALHCAVQFMHGFIVSRVVTSVVLVAVAAGVLSVAL